MNISVIGCGRWGAFIAYYLSRAGHGVTLCGRADSPHLAALRETRTDGVVTLPKEIKLRSDFDSVRDGDCVIISINSQSLRDLLSSGVLDGYKGYIVLCMKGIEISSGKRLSEIAAEYCPSAKIAVWLGPGHVQEFCRGVPNCMVIDSRNADVKSELIAAFSSDLIRFYYGADLIGNEIGAAAKNVIGIAAGMLDGHDHSSLKGALMARGTREIARFISVMGGDAKSAYGLCCLGDFEATVFSQFSHNRQFGEAFVRHEKYESLAEGYYTAAAIKKLSDAKKIDMPICSAIYDILYGGATPAEMLERLFARSLKEEFN